MTSLFSTLFQLNTVLSAKIKADRLFAEADAYREAGENNRAFPVLREASDAGHKYAPALLAVMLMKGEGVAIDWVDAVKYFDIALERGNDKIHFNVGMLHGIGGYGLKRDLKKAEYHLLESQAVDKDPAAGDMVEMVRKRKGPFGAKVVARPKLSW